MSISLKSQPTFIDERKVQNLFEKYDMNKNGVIDPNEFMSVIIDVLKQLGEDLPEKKHLEVVEEGFSKFDLNKNGKIEFNEFFEFIHFLISEKGYIL